MLLMVMELYHIIYMALDALLQEVLCTSDVFLIAYLTLHLLNYTGLPIFPTIHTQVILQLVGFVAITLPDLHISRFDLTKEFNFYSLDIQLSIV